MGPYMLLDKLGSQIFSNYLDGIPVFASERILSLLETLLTL